MIKGIGVDIIEIERVHRNIEQTDGRFVAMVFTETEARYCAAKPHPAQHYAARFAAKEAVSKALATGWSGVFRWKDVEIVNEVSGLPRVQLHGELGRQLAGAAIHLSLSHSESHVVAMAVIEEPAA
jgi:holo-[acyl-carrier protein] synthase